MYLKKLDIRKNARAWLIELTTECITRKGHTAKKKKKGTEKLKRKTLLFLTFSLVTLPSQL